MYKIRDNIPMPSANGVGKVKDELYQTMEKLNVGQSIFFENMSMGNSQHKKLTAHRSHIERYTTQRFSIRKEGNGYAIWCTTKE